MCEWKQKKKKKKKDDDDDVIRRKEVLVGSSKNKKPSEQSGENKETTAWTGSINEKILIQGYEIVKKEMERDEINKVR